MYIYSAHLSSRTCNALKCITGIITGIKSIASILFRLQEYHGYEGIHGSDN